MGFLNSLKLLINISLRVFLLSGSREEVGSSNISISGFINNANAILSFHLFPPDNFLAALDVYYDRSKESVKFFIFTSKLLSLFNNPITLRF